jgi:hypothetical protein
MLLLKTDRLPDCDPWSTRSNDFSIRYPRGMNGLTQLPHETVIDRKMFPIHEEGKPSFNVPRNYGSLTAPVLYFVFDVMSRPGRDVRRNRCRRGVISPRKR